MERAGAVCGWGTPSTRKNTRERRGARRPQTFHHSHTMELTIEEKLDRLEAGLAEIGKRLDALEAAQREGLEQWKADRERWAAADREVLAQYQDEELVAQEEEESAGKLGPAEVAVMFGLGKPMCGLTHENTRGVLTRAASALAAAAHEAEGQAQEEAAGNEQEDRQFSEALKRLDMKSL